MHYMKNGIKKLKKNSKNGKLNEFKKNIKGIIKEFDELERKDVVKPKVGLVGEILVKSTQQQIMML